MLMISLNNLVKQENDTIREFHSRFETMLQKIRMSRHPTHSFLLFIYTKSFTGQLGHLLRDKNPQTIQEAQEIDTRI
jgi:hypothetical protein